MEYANGWRFGLCRLGLGIDALRDVLSSNVGYRFMYMLIVAFEVLC